MKFVQFLKDVILSKFWVKLVAFLLAMFVVLIINL